jgi:hypothetical protein
VLGIVCCICSNGFTIYNANVPTNKMVSMLLDSNKFVSEAMQRRIDAGSLTGSQFTDRKMYYISVSTADNLHLDAAFDLNKLYPLTRRDNEDLSSGLTSRIRGKDRVGVVIGLESCLLDAAAVSSSRTIAQRVPYHNQPFRVGTWSLLRSTGVRVRSACAIPGGR